MKEYLEDVNKGFPICVKELHDNCNCFRCRKEREEKKVEKQQSELLGKNGASKPIHPTS